MLQCGTDTTDPNPYSRHRFTVDVEPHSKDKGGNNAPAFADSQARWHRWRDLAVEISPYIVVGNLGLRLASRENGHNVTRVMGEVSIMLASVCVSTKIADTLAEQWREHVGKTEHAAATIGQVTNNVVYAAERFIARGQSSPQI